jgi:hypothetical protein
MKKKRRGLFWRVDKKSHEMWGLFPQDSKINTAYYAALEGSQGIFGRPRGGKWKYSNWSNGTNHLVKDIMAHNRKDPTFVKNVRVVSERVFNNFAAKHMGELL